MSNFSESPINKGPNDGDGKQTPPQDDAGASQDNDAIAALETDLQKLQDERNALFEQVARVQSDFRNAQKRLESEKLQAIQYANSKLITTLLPVIDNFERALLVDSAKVEAAAILKGLQIVYDQLLAVLKQQNVEVIAPSAGTAFDPNLHQALMQQPTDQYTEPTVTQLLQKGYALHGRVLRPAQVAVSKTS